MRISTDFLWESTQARKIFNNGKQNQKQNKQTSKSGQSRNLCSMKIHFKNEGKNYRLVKASSLSEELHYKKY